MNGQTKSKVTESLSNLDRTRRNMSSQLCIKVKKEARERNWTGGVIQRVYWRSKEATTDIVPI